VGKDLIIKIEIPLTFNKDGSRRRIKVLYSPLPRALCRVKKEVGLTGIPTPFNL
jgi:hypothetical protein